MAARRSAQPLYDVYLAWVIKIQAVQCHRAAATDDSIEKFLFFDAGCRPGLPAHFQWNLDTWDAFPPGPFASVITPVSIPMQRAWNAAVAAFKELIKALANGELIANGLHPVRPARSWPMQASIPDRAAGHATIAISLPFHDPRLSTKAKAEDRKSVTSSA